MSWLAPCRGGPEGPLRTDVLGAWRREGPLSGVFGGSIRLGRGKKKKKGRGPPWPLPTGLAMRPGRLRPLLLEEPLSLAPLPHCDHAAGSRGSQLIFEISFEALISLVARPQFPIYVVECSNEVQQQNVSYV